MNRTVFFFSLALYITGLWMAAELFSMPLPPRLDWLMQYSALCLFTASGYCLLMDTADAMGSLPLFFDGHGSAGMDCNVDFGGGC